MPMTEEETSYSFRYRKYAEALYLWITEGSDEVVALRGAPEFEGGSMIP